MILQKKTTMITCYFCVALFSVFSIPTVVAGQSLPPLPEESTFLDQLELDSYPFLPTPKTAVRLRWDFSGKQVYPYDFSQKVLNSYEMDNLHGSKASNTSHQTIEGDGKLSLKSEGNNVARFVLEDLTMSMAINNPDGGEPRVMKSQAPPMVIQGIKEDGSMKMGNSPQELLLKTLFPLPPTPLKIGESVSVPAQMPFNAMGSLLHVTGNSEIKLVDYVQINGKTCAKLKTEIDISTLNVPVELKGDYKCQVKGRSIFYFNIENRHFVSGKVALLMSMRVMAQAPETNFPKEAEKAGIPETVRMSMDSDNFLSVEYIGN